MKKIFYPLMACFMLAIATTVRGEDGSNLWLRFDNQLNNNVTGVAGVAMDELRQHWKGGAVVLKRQKKMAKDSYSITTKAGKTVIEGADNTALLYGAFHLLRLQQTGQDVSNLNISQRPAYSLRILNHWDNPNGTVERGFAGKSIFLNPTPERMKIYARANASVGINGTVLNNVNAKPEALATDNLKKVKQIAEWMRPYGIKVYLSVNFASPIKLGGLETADPLNAQVIDWWKKKVAEIYQLIPDFGGFLVKANSEGEPGPCDFGRTHAEGANMMADILKKYGKWNIRELYDRNYSECRVPEVPSAILEMLSHQNFADMKMAQDPNFKFDLARSIYKVLLRYTARMHNTSYTVQPLMPEDMSVSLTNKGEAKISWTTVEDALEPTAHPTSFILYTAKDDGDFDNGQIISKSPAIVKLEPDKLYSFRVAAVNDGGESFPSEVVSCLYNPTSQKQVLIVNGFHRLASPEVVDGLASQGFDMTQDHGVSHGLTAGWRGIQTNFDKFRMGKEGPTGLGFTNDSLAGHFYGGNDFDYIRTHAKAIASAHRYSIASCSTMAIEKGYTTLEGYEMTDLILGLERADGYSLVQGKTFTPELQAHLRAFTSQGGNLLVSGSYIGRDMRMQHERKFLEDVLKCQYYGTNNDSLRSDTIQGLGLTFTFYRTPNHKHYAADHPDCLLPLSPAFPAMKYGDDQAACIAYSGTDYRVLTMGFPFECITEEQKREAIMRGILKFLLQ